MVVCFEEPSSWKSLKKVLSQAKVLIVYVFREDDYKLIKAKFSKAEVQYAPDKIKRLFTS